MKNEIKDYLKHSKQVKKYDSIKKMEHDNIISKDKDNINNINDINNNNNIIKEEENESNFNINENNNINIDNNENNNNINNNFIEENPIQGQNKNPIENNNNNYMEENNNNQEEINQDDNNQNQIENENENENFNENDIEQNNKSNNDINIINNNEQQNNNLNNSQISDTKNSNDNNHINEENNNINNIKNNLQNIFNDIIYKSFDEFEKNITIKINQMNNRINDIALKVSDYQSNQLNEGGFSKIKKLGDNNHSQISSRPQGYIDNNSSFYINSRKMRLNSIKDSKNHSINTEEPDYYINNNLDKKESTSIDSEVTKTWKETLKLIEKGNINEGYLKLINSGDDIYLLRLICLTGPIIDKLDIEVAKRVLLRVNMISKSHQIQQLLIGLIKNSCKNNIFQTLEPNQQNYILDSLYEFSGLNNSLATEAAELYAELTK